MKAKLAWSIVARDDPFKPEGLADFAFCNAVEDFRLNRALDRISQFNAQGEGDVDASGTAKLTKKASGWHVDMNATGLARLDNGRYYEAWLKNAAGTLVPIGTFNDARDLELWAGVSPVDYPTLTVTIEAADGNETSSGRRVLIGTIIR